MFDELSVQRRMTAAFIATQPVAITLLPRLREKQPTGGMRWVTQPPRATQVMRLIEPTNSGPRPTVTLDGVERVVDFMLLGLHDAVIGQYDIFTHDGREWEVVSLMHFNGYERRATVARHG